jgi:hypothetical protein
VQIFALDNRVIFSLAFFEGSFFPLKGNLAFDAADHLRDVFPFFDPIKQLKIKIINTSLLVNLLKNADNKLG